MSIRITTTKTKDLYPPFNQRGNQRCPLWLQTDSGSDGYVIQPCVLDCIETSNLNFQNCLNQGRNASYTDPIFTNPWAALSQNSDPSGTYTKTKLNETLDKLIKKIQDKVGSGSSSCAETENKLSGCITIEQVPQTDPAYSYCTGIGGRTYTDHYSPAGMWNNDPLVKVVTDLEGCQKELNEEQNKCGSACNYGNYGSATGSGNCNQCVNSVGLSGFLKPLPPTLKFVSSTISPYPYPELFVKTIFMQGVYFQVNKNIRIDYRDIYSSSSPDLFRINSGTNPVDNDGNIIDCEFCCINHVFDVLRSITSRIMPEVQDMKAAWDEYKKHRNFCAEHFTNKIQTCNFKKCNRSSGGPDLFDINFQIDKVGYSNDFKVLPPRSILGTRG